MWLETALSLAASASIKCAIAVEQSKWAAGTSDSILARFIDQIRNILKIYIVQNQVSQSNYGL